MSPTIKHQEIVDTSRSLTKSETLVRDFENKLIIKSTSHVTRSGARPKRGRSTLRAVRR